MSETGEEGDNDENRGNSETHISLRGVYELGKHMRYVERGAQHQYAVVGSDAEGGRYIVESLEEIQNILSYADFEISIDRDVAGMIQYLNENYDQPDDENDIEQITGEDAKSLLDSYRTWDRLVKEDLNDVGRLAVRGPKLLDIKELMLHPEQLFWGTSVWEELPDRTKRDLSESIYSLAVEVSTGSVFLSLRAVEERLREWYEHETGRDIGDRNFGEVIGELDDQYDEDERPMILSHLDYLKEQRNEVAHPDRSPNVREAGSTLINVRETITNIHQQLPDTEEEDEEEESD